MVNIFRDEIVMTEVTTHTLTLDNAKPYTSYEVLGFEQMPSEIQHRLEALGMTPHVILDVLNNKSKGTLIIRMRDTRFALGKNITRHIRVCYSDTYNHMYLQTGDADTQFMQA